MELENLRKSWQHTAIEEPPVHTTGEVESMLKTPSKLVVDIMKRNLIREAILVIVLYGFITAFFLLNFQMQFMLVSWVAGIAALFYLLLFRMKYRLLQEMFVGTVSLRANLEQRLTSLKKYFYIYVLAGSIQVPLIAWLLVLVYIEKAPIPLQSVNRIQQFLYGFPGILFASLATGALFLLALALNRWYVQKLYGKHAARLEQLLMFLDDEVDPRFN